jgi:hypothetical protein
LQEPSGLFLQAGQSARISAKGELAAVETPPQAPAQTPAQTTAQSSGQSTAQAPPATAGRAHRLWLYLGLAGAGIAAGTAAAVALGGGHTLVSPVAP